MTLAFKLLNPIGVSSKGGNIKWPLPKVTAPGDWISVLYGIGEYYLCKRENICLWIDSSLYVAEFNEMIKEEYDDIIVPDTRLVMKVESWNDNSQEHFMKSCFDRAMSEINPVNLEEKQTIEDLKMAFDAKNLIGVSKFATHLLNEDSNWQSTLIWECVQGEILEKHSLEEFA